MPGAHVSTERARCSRCLGEVIAGHTEYGFAVELDPTELDPPGELAVAVAGGATFTWHTRADRITHRVGYTIRTRPAGTRPRQQVHAAHDCARPSPTPRRSGRIDPDDGGGVPDTGGPPF